MRLAAIAAVLTLVPALSAAQVPSNACLIEMNGVDESFDTTQALLKEAGSGDLAKKCSAVGRHIDALSKGVEVYLRCVAPGAEREEYLASLYATIVSFREIRDGLKCAGELVPVSFTPWWR